MAQGKLKVKAKKPAGAANKSKSANRPGKVTKKGRKVIAPKKSKAQEAHRISKAVEKGIRGNIESTLAARAKQVEEGKAFSMVKAAEGAKDGKKK